MRMQLGLRGLARRPLVPAVVVVTIGLAIGANTALFSVVDGLLFRPLPYKASDRIVHLDLERSARVSLSRADLLSLAERATSTPSLTERADARPAAIFDPNGPASSDWDLRPAEISPSAFDLLGAYPVVGRPFREQDLQEPRFAVLLGYDLWKRRFGGEASIVGHTIEVPGASPELRWRVVGVMPEGFSFPSGANFWIPTYPWYPRPSVMPYARLAPGTTIESIRAELPGIAITSLRERVQPRGALALGVLLVATAMLLLVALVQVAGLLLAQATARVSEVGVRLALGASRGQLARESLLEAALLMLLALGVALLATGPLTALIVRALPPELTLGQQLAPDHRAFASAAVCSAGALVLLTILPIGIIRRTTPLGLLQGRAMGDVRVQSSRVRSALFIGQLAIVTALVYLTALTFHSYVNVTTADLGFDPSNLVAIRMPRGDGLPGVRKARLARQRELVAETIRSVRALSGVTAVAGANFWPMEEGGLRPEALPSSIDPDRYPTPGKLAVITPGLPWLLGIPIMTGAEPSESALADIARRSPPAEQLAVANVALARQLERFGPPVGQLVAGTFRIVGVIGDVRLERPERPVDPTVFVYLPPPNAPAVVLARVVAGRSPEQVGIQEVLARIWGPHTARPLRVERAIALATSEHRARTVLLALVSGLTLPLALVGVAGALSFALRQRTRELAIQLALGAEPRQVQRRVVFQALTSASVALAAGLLTATGLSTLMRSSLFGVAAVDPTAVVGSAVLVLAVVWMAALIPARRASQIDPVQALRE